MIRRRIIFVLVVWMSLSSFGGCASFRWGDTEPPASWPLSKGQGKQSISLLLIGASPYIEGLEESAAKAYKESGLFSDVKTRASETDLRAEVDVSMSRSETSESDVYVPVLTLFLFPIIQRNEIVLRTTLKNKEGQELGVVEKKDGYTELDGLLMIFFMPFKWPNTIESNLLYDLNRATISQANDEGLFQP
ncbi:MAG TPA: hypothetical protein VJT11_11415 [Nitrospiraceae bacterium]|nr:hypothetical protein [Nitrospiraceae bacterium]